MDALAALIPSDAPISATVMAAFVLATLALVFVALARRDREPGLAWLSAGFALAAVWYAFEAGRPPGSPRLDSADERAWAALIIVATLAMSVGVIDYLGHGRRRARAWGLLLAPSLGVLLALALGAAVPRVVANLATMVCYLGLGVLALRRSRDEPGHGHVLLLSLIHI